MTSPYFTAKAREVFAAAGGDPDLSDTLAGWAEAFRIGPHYDSRVGVIVAEDGTILAETLHIPAQVDPGATYVTRIHAYLTDSAEWDELINLELGLACGRLRRLSGQGVIHVTASQVCTGAGKFVKEGAVRETVEPGESGGRTKTPTQPTR